MENWSFSLQSEGIELIFDYKHTKVIRINIMKNLILSRIFIRPLQLRDGDNIKLLTVGAEES